MQNSNWPEVNQTVTYRDRSFVRKSLIERRAALDFRKIDIRVPIGLRFTALDFELRRNACERPQRRTVKELTMSIRGVEERKKIWMKKKREKRGTEKKAEGRMRRT